MASKSSINSKCSLNYRRVPHMFDQISKSAPCFFHSVLLHRRPWLISIGHITGHWVAIFRGWRSITPAARMRHGVAKVQEEGRWSLYHFLQRCEKHPESELRLVSNMRPTKIGMISMAWKGKVHHGSIGLSIHFWDKTYMLDVLYIYEFVYQRNHATYIRNIQKMLCFSAKPLSFKWWPVIKSVIKSPVLHPSHRLVVEDIDGVVVAFGVFHTSLSAGRGRMHVCRQLEIQLLHSTSEICEKTRIGSGILWMEEILHQLIDGLSYYLLGFNDPRWCRISSIHCRKQKKKRKTDSPPYFCGAYYFRCDISICHFHGTWWFDLFGGLL